MNTENNPLLELRLELQTTTTALARASLLWENRDTILIARQGTTNAELAEILDLSSTYLSISTNVYRAELMGDREVDSMLDTYNLAMRTSDVDHS